MKYEGDSRQVHTLRLWRYNFALVGCVLILDGARIKRGVQIPGDLVQVAMATISFEGGS